MGYHKKNPLGSFLRVLVLTLLSSCALTEPDYTLFREHFPRSILVLPAVNLTADVEASTAYLPTVSTVLAEAGYYVFPIAIVDQFLKENGVGNPEEMHEVPLAKLEEVFGADAVLYVTIEEWGTKYLLIHSQTQVTLSYRLVDTSSGAVLWTARQTVSEDSGHQSDLLSITINAAVHAIGNTLSAPEPALAREANSRAFTQRHRLLRGPYHPKHHQDVVGDRH